MILYHLRSSARDVDHSLCRYNASNYRVHQLRLHAQLRNRHLQCRLSTRLSMRSTTTRYILLLSVYYLVKATSPNWPLSVSGICRCCLMCSNQITGIVHINKNINVLVTAVVETSRHQLRPGTSWRCYRYLFSIIETKAERCVDQSHKCKH